MNSYEELTREEVVSNIRKISEEAKEELSKEKIDEKKLFQLRYRQLIQGLYLQTTTKNN